MRAVYLLRSLRPRGRRPPRCYVGFAVCPRRRLRQHNGGRGRGGARRTSGGGPWVMELFVHGFPCSVAALTFEWAWQHPSLSRRLRALPLPPRRGEPPLARALRTLPLLLRAPPWCRLPLRLRWLRPPPHPPLSPAPPAHVVFEEGGEGLSPAPCRKRRKAPPPSQAPPPQSCDLCGGGFEAGSPPPLRCPLPPCLMAAHPPCLARRFLSAEPRELLPLGGACPSCQTPLLWGDLIRHHRALYDGAKGGGPSAPTPEAPPCTESRDLMAH